MLKPQDIILLCKFINCPESRNWTQQKLSRSLNKSISTINESLHRLNDSNLISFYIHKDIRYYPSTLSQEFLKYGVPYMFYDSEDVLKIANDTFEGMR